MNKLILLTILLTASACKKQPKTETSGLSNTAPAQAKPFKGSVYRTVDYRQVITLVSPDELELQEQGANLIGKYTVQDGTLRVVANVMGTTQALYYRITPNGLQANNGALLLEPKHMPQLWKALRQKNNERNKTDNKWLRN